MLEADYLPSLWRVWDTTLRILLSMVFGTIALSDLLAANANVHRRLANSRRRRQPHVAYPLRH
jgi:hypothetical protein